MIGMDLKKAYIGVVQCLVSCSVAYGWKCANKDLDSALTKFIFRTLFLGSLTFLWFTVNVWFIVNIIDGLFITAAGLNLRGVCWTFG
jgi:uncharacterized membrane protein